MPAMRGIDGGSGFTFAVTENMQIGMKKFFSELPLTTVRLRAALHGRMSAPAALIPHISVLF